MKFKHETVEYSLPEFFEKFSNSLPKLVIVAQGFCGEILAETFDKDQVLRLHTFSSHRRVVAQRKDGKDYYSIPLDYPVKFQIVINNIASGDPMSLQDAIISQTLPTEVQFAYNQFVTVGASTVSTRQLPQLILTETFDEIYFLGNFISDGEIDLRVVPVPLYLSQMTVSLITGIQDQLPQHYQRYLQDLDGQVNTAVQFDVNYGNRDIGVYTPGAIHANTIYANLEPVVYVNLESLWHSTRAAKTSTIDKTAAASTPKDTDQKKSSIAKLIGEIESKFKHSTHDHQKGNQSPASKPTTKIKVKSNKKTDEKESDSKKEEEETPPVVPQRSTSLSSTSTHSHDDLELVQQPYEMIEVAQNGTEESSKVTEVKPEVAERKPTRSDLSAGEVRDLSVDDVGRWLKILRLDKHVEKFRDEMVDGEILNELDKQILQNEFGLTGVETIRLMKFAKDGYVPK